MLQTGLVTQNSTTEFNMSDDSSSFSFRLNAALNHCQVPAKGQGRQTFVAKMFDVSQNGARKWLEGEGMPKTERIMQIAQRLGVRAEWLLSGQGDMLDGHAKTLPADTPNLRSGDRVLNLPSDLSALFLAYNEGGQAKKEALKRLSQLPEQEMGTLLLVLQSIGEKYHKDGNDSSAR
ncbi:hypothetical protein CCP4SC76_100008 [Gammaproteobacteria bacterium]